MLTCFPSLSLPTSPFLVSYLRTLGKGQSFYRPREVLVLARVLNAYWLLLYILQKLGTTFCVQKKGGLFFLTKMVSYNQPELYKTPTTNSLFYTLYIKILFMDKTQIQYFRCCFLDSSLKIKSCGYLTKKYTSIPCGKIHLTES